MQLQDGNVMEIFSELRKKYPEVHILIYTMSPEDIFGKRMMNLGSHGFLSKQSSEAEVTAHLNFFKGRKYISQQLQDQLNEDQLKNGKNENPFNQLSEREIEVLIHLLKGESVKEIANHLNIKSNTVATFKARLFDKIGVSNLIDLQNMARLYNFRVT